MSDNGFAECKRSITLLAAIVAFSLSAAAARAQDAPSQPDSAQQPAATTPARSQPPDSAQQPATTAAPTPQQPGATPLPEAPTPLPPAPSLPQSLIPGKNVPLDQQAHPVVRLRTLPIRMLQDGENIFVSPIYLRRNDLKWMLPLAGATVASLNLDSTTMRDVVSHDPSFNSASVNVSDGLRDGFIALPLTLYAVGQAGHQEHAKESGILGGEAMLDAYIVDEVVKLCSWRERPGIDSSRGAFFSAAAGPNSSFISGHSMLAWSSAAVIAGEYNSGWVKTGIYTAATGVALTRVMGQQHFPTDVLLGSAGGWLIGHYVLRAHRHWSQHHPAPAP